jgi:hypothetical protein
VGLPWGKDRALCVLCCASGRKHGLQSSLPESLCASVAIWEHSICCAGAGTCAGPRHSWRRQQVRHICCSRCLTWAPRCCRIVGCAIVLNIQCCAVHCSAHGRQCYSHTKALTTVLSVVHVTPGAHINIALVVVCVTLKLHCVPLCCRQADHAVQHCPRCL